jgi:hypothetical protein
MNGHDTNALHCRITIAGTVGERFAQGCMCEVTAHGGRGTSILECDVTSAAGLGVVLAGLANLGVEVLAVDIGARDRDDRHGGESR